MVNYINGVSTFSFFFILVSQLYFCSIKYLIFFFYFGLLTLFFFNQMSKLFDLFSILVS